ncbi:hypothetical protein MMC30_007264 [Trapelia coarctata]|nr:hypothetical protein [Trapelia coarctata]
MAFRSVSALHLLISLLASLCIIFRSSSASPTDYFHCDRSDTAGPPPLAPDCLYIFNHLPGLSFASDTGSLSAHATSNAKPISLKMSLRSKPLPTKGAIIRHGTCQLRMSLYSFAGAAWNWPQRAITPQQAHYYYYPAARTLGKELVEACVVGKKAAGWINKGFKFPGYIDAGVDLKIHRVGDAAVKNNPPLQMFDI